ncbi:hypothetical protein PoB_007322700 [Plakobranchus ocellatus]|uniref:Secreted protein n=1 Tax=Plakobranchus ocellatus TaxID=259542 RepID=A0AAV4DR10_9GAST|nr:hypothetical protein PoB_007322700 [Plakobranchus ocellatus]
MVAKRAMLCFGLQAQNFLLFSFRVTRGSTICKALRKLPPYSSSHRRVKRMLVAHSLATPSRETQGLYGRKFELLTNTPA